MRRFSYRAGWTAAAVIAIAFCCGLLGWTQALASPGLSPARGSGPAAVGEAAALPPGTASLGSVRASMPIALDIVLKPRDPAGLERFALAVSSPRSPSYRRFIGPGEFGSRFGPTVGALAKVRATLRRLGLPLGSVSANRLVFSVRTTAARAERALGTAIGRFELSSGRVVFANTAAPVLPGAIARYVQAVVGLDDVVRLLTLERRPARGLGTTVRPGRSRRPGAEAL